MAIACIDRLAALPGLDVFSGHTSPGNPKAGAQGQHPEKRAAGVPIYNKRKSLTDCAPCSTVRNHASLTAQSTLPPFTWNKSGALNSTAPNPQHDHRFRRAFGRAIYPLSRLLHHRTLSHFPLLTLLVSLHLPSAEAGQDLSLRLEIDRPWLFYFHIFSADLKLAAWDMLIRIKLPEKFGLMAT